MHSQTDLLLIQSNTVSPQTCTMCLSFPGNSLFHVRHGKGWDCTQCPHMQTQRWGKVNTSRDEALTDGRCKKVEKFFSFALLIIGNQGMYYICFSVSSVGIRQVVTTSCDPPQWHLFWLSFSALLPSVQKLLNRIVLPTQLLVYKPLPQFLNSEEETRLIKVAKNYRYFEMMSVYLENPRVTTATIGTMTMKKTTTTTKI